MTMQPTVYAAGRHLSDDSYGGTAYINHCWRCDLIRHDDAPAMLCPNCGMEMETR